MGGARITPHQKRLFFELLAGGMSVLGAARRIKIGHTSAYELSKGREGQHWQPENSSGRVEGEVPAPKPYSALSADARAALADINLFAEMFLARRPSPWRYEASQRIGELLASPERQMLDVNVFPGAGKTSLFSADLPLWLLCGGFTEDPAHGRALRVMLGASTMRVSKDYVKFLRRMLTLKNPYYDRVQKRSATHLIPQEYGRFRPDGSLGDENIWSSEQFLVAQLGSLEVYQKESTVQAAARDSAFLGERCDLALWDDIAIVKNASNPEIANQLDSWFQDEAETRVEPSGLLVLIGQRLSPLDLHRKRLDARVENEAGEQVPLYSHVIYPAHHDQACDGEHRQHRPATETEPEDGCLTDAWRLPAADWLKVRSKANYRTVYQQEDADPAQILVQPVWLAGGTDPVTGFEAPGCYDRDRGFHEWPAGVGKMVDFLTIDPSVANWWVAQWWAVQPETRHAYLIEGRRRKMMAKDLLDWSHERQEFSGWIHEMVEKSYELSHPIRAIVLEQNAAHKYLSQFEHFRRWRGAFPSIAFIPHTTGGTNKSDPELGVAGLLPTLFRDGMMHLPKKQGMDALNFLRVYEKELTTWPFSETDDCVMSTWFGFHRLDKILSHARRDLGQDARVVDQNMPPYLRRQQRSISMEQRPEDEEGGW